jgi:DNA-binding CsgD family transcriptional regulator
MCISRNTVRNHIQHILVKLGVHSRLQALATAYRLSA